jgi:signal transduction histidine kinase
VNVMSVLKKFEKPIVTLLGSLSLTAVLLNLDFSLLEANLYDFRVSRGIQTQADPRILLVTLDDATASSVDEFSPLPLDLHARFMEALEKHSPRGVGYLVDLNRVNQVNPELFQKEWGDRFVNSARRMQANGTIVMLGTPYDVTGELIPPFPLSTLPHSVAVVHKDGNVFAEDKITRRALVELADKPVFHLEFARQLDLVPQTRLPRGSFLVPEVEGEYFFFRYHGSPVLRADKSLPYTRVSFHEILNGTVSPEILRDKIVLVGTLSKEDSSDFAFTPYSKVSFTNPKIAIHANILDSVIHDDGIVRADKWVNWLATFTVTTIVITWVMNFTPMYGVFATISLGSAFLLFGMFLFQSKGFWIRQSQPLVGIFVAYYLVVPYRLIREYKTRWDYQRKNDILLQVEELKRNFMSLVTHDLKTPVARIQGLAETLLRRSGEVMTSADAQNLEHIIYSTEELNRFISGILELSRIESNRLHLNIESKDINRLIERALELFEPQAIARQIKITTQLEPLFPIKLDASLISKVLNNLIDNAIKYSPQGSEIRVETREINDRIEISIHDQGIGMSDEEKQNLFTRFYRAKNDTTTRVPGTGLGLYLTKYFVEAHAGTVRVESTIGQGSVFHISLPLEAPAESTLPSLNTAFTPVTTRKGFLPALQVSLPNRSNSKVGERENA